MYPVAAISDVSLLYAPWSGCSMKMNGNWGTSFPFVLFCNQVANKLQNASLISSSSHKFVWTLDLKQAKVSNAFFSIHHRRPSFQPADSVALFDWFCQSFPAPVLPEGTLTLRLCSSSKSQSLGSSTPNLFLANSLLCVYSKCGHFSYAHKMFDQMPDRDIVSWTSLISGYRCNGSPNAAFPVFLDLLLHICPEWIYHRRCSESLCFAR